MRGGNQEKSINGMATHLHEHREGERGKIISKETVGKLFETVTKEGLGSSNFRLVKAATNNFAKRNVIRVSGRHSNNNSQRELDFEDYQE